MPGPRGSRLQPRHRGGDTTPFKLPIRTARTTSVYRQQQAQKGRGGSGRGCDHRNQAGANGVADIDAEEQRRHRGDDAPPPRPVNAPRNPAAPPARAIAGLNSREFKWRPDRANCQPRRWWQSPWPVLCETGGCWDNRAPDRPADPALPVASFREERRSPAKSSRMA